MGCDFPLKAFRSASQRGSSGKPLLTFDPLDAINSTSPMEVPCNNCVGCKLEYARQWSIRIMHEKRFYPESCFITLTYDDQHVPQDYGLSVRHLQLFMKKYRRLLEMKMKHRRGEHSAHIRRYCLHSSKKIRFFACGEYGDVNGRPHYHAIIFNDDWPDKVFHSTSDSGEKIYTSEALRRLWGNGVVSTQDVTHKSAAYVARYVTKKIKTGDAFGADRYYRLSPVDGAFHSVAPEFATRSNRPGLGTKFVEQFKGDFYPSGFLVIDGVRQAPPKFYVSKLSEKEQERLKRQARRLSLKSKPHTTTERRLARAAVRDARIQKLQRKL